jgi:hypothetical protein
LVGYSSSQRWLIAYFTMSARLLKWSLALQRAL